MADIAEPLNPPASASKHWGDLSIRLRRGAEFVVIPLLALAISALLFSILLLVLGKSPIEFFQLVERGGFGTSFSLQNTPFGAGASEAARKAATEAIAGLKAKKPIYVGLLKDNKGNIVISKTYDNLDPFLDKMNYLLEGVVGSIT